MELCIPRNRHRRSAKRYRGLANVTTRRARKGFNIRYNPDAHWSSAFYKGLNQLQYQDGSQILNINRDDAAGFRLDTITTCKQYATPTVRGSDVLTTRTDYVNKHPSVIQTTSYNFSKTNTTPEVCIGVVKATPVHHKNPAQHYSDLMMLSQKELLQPVFNLSAGKPKLIDCVRVDGASDEGPGHESVQYLWTEWHISQSKALTLVTTRSSGSSYLNRVELQNGSLSLGHANTFIPSTLGGSCVDPETGSMDHNRLKENLNLAISAYISRVDGCPCGMSSIKLFRGSDSQKFQDISGHLDVFLKGSKKQKEELQQQHPDVFNQFSFVWNIRNRHMVKGLPTPYIFLLKCCFSPDCLHPLCKLGSSHAIQSWYPGGPNINCFPLPFPDPECVWGCTSCETCKSVCSGHYITKFIDMSKKEDLNAVVMPPSIVLKEMFTELDKSSDREEFIQCAAMKVLLPVEETEIWFDHLQTVVNNRKRGAAKAAATRQRKKLDKGSQLTQASDKDESKYQCGSCSREYGTSDSPFWIFCDLCQVWFCSHCEKLNHEPKLNTYSCRKCSRTCIS